MSRSKAEDTALIQDAFSVPIINPNLLEIEVNVPGALRPALEANKHLMPKFVTSISRAVQASFEHPDTRLRGDIKRDEVQLRVGLCYEALRQMYFEEKMSLIHSLDILPQVIIDALRMGQASPGDLVSGYGGNAWGVPQEPDLIMTPGDDDLNDGGNDGTA
jgi:hypothetical protein